MGVFAHSEWQSPVAFWWLRKGATKQCEPGRSGAVTLFAPLSPAPAKPSGKSRWFEFFAAYSARSAVAFGAHISPFGERRVRPAKPTSISVTDRKIERQ